MIKLFRRNPFLEPPMSLKTIIIGLFAFSMALAAHTPEANGPQDPNAVIAELTKGNERFAAGTSAHPDLGRDRRIETSKNGQKPIAAVLGCADSRVPVEDIFDVGIGTLFVVRVAGNVAEKSQVGSIEYGVGHLGIPLVIVLGHTKCGAVTAAVEGPPDASVPLRSILNNIEPAVAKAKKESGEIDEDALVAKSISENVMQAIDDILRTSAAVRSLVKAGKVKVVGAIYDLETGKVAMLGVHYRQDQLIKKYDEKKVK
jgi:carbonic anhydrase